MEFLRKISFSVLLEFEGAENESGKCPKAILVNGFADVESHCERCELSSDNSWSVGCPKRFVGPRKPMDIVLSNETNR